jgi:aminocarboxymuconate-semialdehyde decarboxylase
MTVIDVHTHMLCREYLELLAEYGAPQYQRTVNQAGQDTITSLDVPFFTLTEPMWDYGLRIRDMDAAGVDLAIVSLTCPNVYFGIGAISLQAARLVNDSMAAEQAARPDRIRWLASLPWQYPDLALGELERAVAAGAVGIMVIATIADRPLTDPAFAPIWAAIDRHRLPVLVHPGPPAAAGELGLAEFGLVPSVGFPFDTTLAFARIFFDGFLDRYPHLKLIAAHGGGALPYLAGRLDQCHAEIPAASAKTKTPPSEFMRRIWYDAVVYGADALALCIEHADSDERVLFGSDYPHNIGDMTGCLARVTALAPPAAERIQGKNAQRLFNL